MAVLQQRRSQLDDFFAALANQPLAGRRKLCVVLAPYDPGCALNLANLKRRYHSDLPVHGIPYDTEFADAWSDRDVLSFFAGTDCFRSGAARGKPCCHAAGI